MLHRFARRCWSSSLVGLVVSAALRWLLRPNRCARWSAVILATRWQCAYGNARDAGVFARLKKREKPAPTIPCGFVLMYCLICQSDAFSQGWNNQRTDPEGDKTRPRVVRRIGIQAAQTHCRRRAAAAEVVFWKALIVACILQQEPTTTGIPAHSCHQPTTGKQPYDDADRIAASTKQQWHACSH